LRKTIDNLYNFVKLKEKDVYNIVCFKKEVIHGEEEKSKKEKNSEEKEKISTR